MARRPQTDDSGENIQGYFRPFFEQNPKLLRKRSNKELFQRWLDDHPGVSEVPKEVKTGLANLKSVMRRKLGIRAKSKSAAENGAEPAAAARTTGRRGGLGPLEAAIDDALVLARQTDAAGLEDIIKLLRVARNRVILRSGEA